MSTAKRKPVLGETLVRVTSPRWNKGTSEILQVTVTHVGRKFFTVVPQKDEHAWKESVHYLEGWGEKTGTNYASRLYGSEQEIRDEAEALAIRGDMQKAFGGYGIGSLSRTLTLDQLRRIKAIVEEGNPG